MDDARRGTEEHVRFLEMIDASLSLLRRHPLFKKIVKFCITGGIAAIIDLGGLQIMVRYLSVPEEAAVVLSSCISVIFVFITNKFFTFRDTSDRYARQITKFILVYGFAIALNGAVSNVFLWLGFHYLIAKVIAIGIGAVINFVLSNSFVFRQMVPAER